MENGVVARKLMDAENAKVDHMAIDTVGGSSVSSKEQEFFTFTKHIPEDKGNLFQKLYPKMKWALDEYGISSTLNMHDLSITISTTPKNKDMRFLTKVKLLFLLVSIGVPLDKALRTLGAYPIVVPMGERNNGLCAQFKIKKEKYLERRKLLSHKTLKELSELTGCDLYLHEDSVYVATGSREGMVLARKIVTDCIVRGVSPRLRIKRMNRVIDDLGAFRF